MRYLRLIPLLVLAFGAPASADDHRVNFNGMLSLASGSSLFGAHGSVRTQGRPSQVSRSSSATTVTTAAHTTRTR